MGGEKCQVGNLRSLVIIYHVRAPNTLTDFIVTDLVNIGHLIRIHVINLIL